MRQPTTTMAATLLLLLAFMAPQAVQAASTTVAAAEDTYASQGTPNTPHGTLAYVAVNAPTGERRTYLKFMVAGVPVNATNLTVSLRLWAESSSSATFSTLSAPTTWTENALTWNNQPALGAVIGTRTGMTGGQYNSFDVTSHVTGNGTWAVAVTKSTSTQLTFTSREATTNHPPQLTLSWTTSTTTTSATTTTGATTTTSAPTSGGTVAASEDSYASQGTSNTTHGTLSYLAVNAPAGERWTYLKFAVASVPANATNVTASLRLWAETSSSAAFTASRAPSTWTESGLTWNNRPALGAVVTTRTGLTSGQYNTFDLTPYVTGNGTWAVALTGSTSTQVKFTAREATTNHPPQLSLAWTIPAVTSTGTSTTVGTTTTTQPSGTDPVLAAAGDIACAPGIPTTETTCHHAATSDLIVGSDITAVQLLGDNQYDGGSLADYNASYDPTWGRAKAKTHPAPGNHEYDTPGAAGYFSYFGAAAGDPAKGYYSYNLGAWHVVVLNSEIAHDAGSAQVQWLREDLAANPANCTLAVWHHPRFTSGGTHGPDVSTAPFWDVLHDAGADLALAGHEHSYERFAPQRPDGTADPARGIREFVVGSGGKTHYGFTTPAANSEVRNGTTFGVLKLTLRPTSYDWQFVPEAGQTFTDAGSGSCH